MNRKDTITTLTILIAIIAAITASVGIFSDFGPGPYDYESIRGQKIEIYGKGVYQHMSGDVAIQGIAHDFITLFAGIPVLIISLIGFRKNSVRSQFVLSGALGYFLVTFMFFTAMGMYNIMFLGYVSLMGLSFFGLFLVLWSFDFSGISKYFSWKTPTRFVGWFLIVNAVLIGLMWLDIVIPPLIDGSIYPEQLKHYTTLIVQGFDLGLLLPISFVVGFLLIKQRPSGYLFATVYIVFLSLLMTALSAKVVAMAGNDVNVIPAIFIIPTINLITILSAIFMIRSIQNN
jgi:hypothetical protein